ncbi:MAG: glycosyltransferase, partial [Acidimicrobiales bacterium]
MARLGDDERLRVLRVIARMNVGGPARQVAVLSRHLDPTRFEQRLLVGSVGAGEADDLQLRDVDLPHRRVAGLGRAPNGLDDVRALATLVREVRRFRPHIVHTHTAKAGVLGRVAALAARAPGSGPALVHTFHGHLLHGYFPARITTAVIAAERLLARRTDRLVAVGARVRDELLAAGIGRPDRWAVLPPGIELRAVPDRAAAR